MAAIPYHQFLASDIVIVRTVSGDEFRVHEVLICQSPVFRAAFTGNFKEGQEKVMSVEEDSETMSRLLENLYTGDYPLPGDKRDPTFDSSVHKAPIARESSLDTVDGEGTDPTTKDSFYALRFLSHAKLYSAAKIFDLADVSNTVLGRIRIELKSFSSHASSHIPDIAELVSYVYDDEIVAADDPIRGLITRFVALNLGKLRELKDYDILEALIAEKPLFARDLVRLIDIYERRASGIAAILSSKDNTDVNQPGDVYTEQKPTKNGPTGSGGTAIQKRRGPKFKMSTSIKSDLQSSLTSL